MVQVGYSPDKVSETIATTNHAPGLQSAMEAQISQPDIQGLHNQQLAPFKQYTFLPLITPWPLSGMLPHPLQRIQNPIHPPKPTTSLPWFP